MPYIDSYKKNLLDKDIKPLVNKLLAGDNIDYGSIEYVFFRILIEAAEVSKRFTNLNSLAGVLTTTQFEFIDKILRPYENSKHLSEWAGERLYQNLVGKKKKPRRKKKSKK